MLAKVSVADYMSKSIISVTPETKITQAIKKLLDHKITSMPVVDEHGKLIGIFSEKDGVKVVIESAYNQSMDSTVGEFMSKEPLTINADESLVDAALKFQDTAIRSFPVYRSGELVGMISRIDVMKALLPLR